MFLNNVNELKIGQKVQYIGTTLELFGLIMKVESINEESQQCKLVTSNHYLRFVDRKNILLINQSNVEQIFVVPDSVRFGGSL